MHPLMDVGTPWEIHLTFFSLIKLFKSIDVEQKSVTWAPVPEGLPQGLQASDVQQVTPCIGKAGILESVTYCIHNHSLICDFYEYFDSLFLISRLSEVI